MKENLSTRSMAVLLSVIQDYILKAEPVSSKAVATNYSIGVSPATVRNTMAELEAAGYLVQPHTSAGRIPSEKGFRLYVDNLLKLEEPLEAQKALIRENCTVPVATGNIMRAAGKTLSALTYCAGLVIAAGPAAIAVREIRFLRVDSTHIMVVMVSVEGLVRTGVVRAGEETERLDLDRASNYLNSFAAGLSLTALRTRVLEEMRSEKNLYDELMANTLRLAEMAFAEMAADPLSDLYVEGTANILDQPEFAEDIARMKQVFNAFEEKSLLLKILDRSMEEGRVHICLGSESNVKEFEGLGFVVAPYGKEGETLGTLGVIGPLRMNYSKIIPLVDYTAGLFGRII
ncbi:MAG: heat-inducible transcriptional repressor HrcA [Thermodesulfobacteriota bacterium]